MSNIEIGGTSLSQIYINFASVSCKLPSLQTFDMHLNRQILQKFSKFLDTVDVNGMLSLRELDSIVT